MIFFFCLPLNSVGSQACTIRANSPPNIAVVFVFFTWFVNFSDSCYEENYCLKPWKWNLNSEVEWLRSLAGSSFLFKVGIIICNFSHIKAKSQLNPFLLPFSGDYLSPAFWDETNCFQKVPVLLCWCNKSVEKLLSSKKNQPHMFFSCLWSQM